MYTAVPGSIDPTQVILRSMCYCFFCTDHDIVRLPPGNVKQTIQLRNRYFFHAVGIGDLSEL